MGLTIKLRHWIEAHWIPGIISVAAFFLIFGYECIRSASNSLFRESYGVANIPMVMAFLPIALIAVLALYNRSLARFGSRSTLRYSTVLSGLFILICLIAIQSGIALARGVLFVIREIYIMLIIEQYWSFVNSTFNREFAKKFNGIFLGIATSGAIFGGMFVHHFSIRLGTQALPYFTVLALVPALFLFDWAYGRVPQDRLRPELKRETASTRKIFFESPLLVIVLGMVLSTQVIATVVDLAFQTHLESSISGTDAQTAYSGQFFAILSTVSIALQFIGSPLTLRYLPLRFVYLALPVANLAAGLALWLSPSLWTASVALLVFKSIDYSVFRAAKEILYIPLSFDARFRAKEFIDVFGYRFGKGGMSLFIVALKRLGWMGASFFPASAVFAGTVWLTLVFSLLRGSRSTEAVVLNNN